MSEPQTETDVEPTPGPWELDEIAPSGLMKPIFVESGDATICAMAAFLEPNSHVDPKEALANARLIAAAGTAAQEAKEMGYDPQKAVEALPELLRMIENAAIDLTDLRAFVAQNERHNIKTTRSARRVLQKALAKAGADETMIPGDDGEVDDALARAEGSRDE